jgi:magnesium chelatase accessory protein
MSHHHADTAVPGRVLPVSRALDWDRDGRHWPHRASSRFIQAAGMRWHVQRMGQGPVAVLLHGTGSATHSWRGLLPLMATHFDVIALDLPGHGFTGRTTTPRLSLPGMAAQIGALLKALEVDPQWVVGHSAGAAIGARMVMDGQVHPRALIAVNGAFFPLGGVPGVLFPPTAKLMAALPGVPQWFARQRWDEAAVRRLMAGTGSALDAAGLALYGSLVRNPVHAAGALDMMANWDLRPLVSDLCRWKLPIALLVGAKDRAVPPSDAPRLRRHLPPATPMTLSIRPDAGHLLHEEQAAWVGEQILAFIRANAQAARVVNVT